MAAPIILCDTAGMTNERWLECRMHGPNGDIPYTVGGSDVATIFGVSPWTTPLELWMIKKGRMKAKNKSNSNQLAMGHMLEPIAAYFYALKTGDTVINDTNMYRHADYKYALADFDRRFVRASDGEKGILECKSCTYHKASDWADGAYPLYYELQLRYYLAVADVNLGAFSTIWGNNPDNDMAMPTLIRDKAKEDMIFEKLDEWIWSLENDKPPTMTGIPSKLALESLSRIYDPSKPALPTIEFSRKQERTLRNYLAIKSEIDDHKAQIKILTERMDSQTARIAEMMKDHEHGVLETTTDRILIDFITKQSIRTDTKKLKKEYPSVYTDVITTSDTRKLNVSVQPL